mmetsp:Transcript_33661/g.66197  ORF Transcript_33661/g.66197 Transcript_33661/m.66197 type:complete len:1170 (+) Transcript_33661:123-3632(+)
MSLQSQPNRARADSRGSNVSNVSAHSKLSNASSLISKTSSKASGYARAMFHPRSTTHSVAEMVNLQPGDLCETVSLVTVRGAMPLDSVMFAELPTGTTLEVLEIGEGRRIKVKSENDGTGWISSKTRSNMPLVAKSNFDISSVIEDFFEAGGEHEVKSIVTMRQGEGLDSVIIAELKLGTRIKILEMGTENKRRAKIQVNDIGEGWISVCTKTGEVLVGKVTDGKTSGRGGGGGMMPTGSSKIKDLLEAAWANDVDTIQRLVQRSSGFLQRGPDLNSSDIRGKTALMYAAAFGHTSVVQYLLSRSKEVDVNLVDDTKKSALHHACKRVKQRRLEECDEGQAEIVDMLLEAQAQLEARDHNGCTAIMFATANSVTEVVVERLLAANAQVDVADFEGNTPLDYALHMSNSGIAKLLRAHGAEGQEDFDDAENQSVVGEDETPESGKDSMVDPAGAAVVGVAAGTAAGVATKKIKKEKKEKKEKKDPKDPDGKKKKEPKKPGNNNDKKKTKVKALAEVVEDEPEGVLVVMQTEDMDEKKRALFKLGHLLQSSTSEAEIEAAIKDAQNCGASEQDLQDAEQAVKALTALHLAVADKNVKELKDAIERARGAKVAAKAISKAEDVLKKEEPKQAARDRLNSIKNSGHADQLRAALDDGKRVGLDNSDLAEYEKLLEGAESKEKSQAALVAAMKEKNVSDLKYAITQAQDVGVDSATIKQAQDILRQEEPKQKARDKLAEACKDASTAGLRAAINEAQQIGLDAAEIAEAKTMLAEEEEKEKLLGEVNQVLQEVADVPADIDALRAAKDKVNAAIERALKSGVSEAALGPADIRRKKLHNMVEDLKGSIRVYCRIRPLSKKEEGQGDTMITNAVDAMTLEVSDQRFGFDSVWTPGTQEEVFDDSKDLVQSAVDGYNVTMFAYGQTGAGKTFTMYGVPGKEGTAPRTIEEIFRVTEAGKDRYNFTVMGSMLELYRNDLLDLLSKEAHGKGKSDAKKLNVRQEKSGSVMIEHLTEEQCTSAASLMSLLERGTSKRTVAATAMNSESSRSHLVLIIKIVSVNRETKAQLQGKILIVDLAGSERLKKSQVEAHMQKEAIEINKSLTALGDVIEALTKGSNVIPYRNHKLTQLMQDSLGGTAKTLMFVNCSPANSNFDETVNSLKYATRAKTITNNTKKR